MKVELEQVLPGEIEKRSFEIITEELGDRILDGEKAPLIKRVIHTSADFDYADTLCFSDDVIAKALEAIRCGASIVTDTQMGRTGGLCQRDSVQGADHGNRGTLYCRKRQKGRQQCGGGHLQCVIIYDR